MCSLKFVSHDRHLSELCINKENRTANAQCTCVFFFSSLFLSEKSLYHYYLFKGKPFCPDNNTLTNISLMQCNLFGPKKKKTKIYPIRVQFFHSEWSVCLKRFLFTVANRLKIVRTKIRTCECAIKQFVLLSSKTKTLIDQKQL